MNEWGLLLVYLLCGLASAFFSGSETAIPSLSDSAVYRLKQEGHPGAARLERLRAELPTTIGTLLVGNTVVNILSGSIGTALAIGLWGERLGVLVATIVTTLLLLVFCEVTPKTLAARRPESVALLVSRPVELCVTLLRPMTGLLAFLARLILRPFGTAGDSTQEVSEADVKNLISLSHHQGALEKEEKELLNAVLDFGDTPAKEVMVSRAKIVFLPADASFDQVESILKEHRFSRYPVFRGTQDEVVGVLHAKDLFDVSDEDEKSFELSRYLRPAVFVPELKKAGDLFREMRRRRMHMVVVVDEQGSISGLVTLEDLIEQIVGDIADEHDEPTKRPVSDGTSLIVEGTYPLVSLERELGLSLDEGDVESVGGFLLQKFGRIPRAGARTSVAGLDFLVERASPRVIERVRITRKTVKRKAS